MSILTWFFLALIPYAASISFNFTNITPKNSQEITISGNGAAISKDGIQVTSASMDLIGRATYIEPLHLWDNDSTELASFSTSFTFMINSYQTGNYADGLTFFLAQINSDMYSGGSVGLPFDLQTSTSKNRFVAVEFDTYRNEWDPIDPDTNTYVGDHVGIDINSITSVAYQKWFSNITYGKECRALINYYADSKNLSVSFTNFKNNIPVWDTGLKYTVDLRKELPEWVSFGFSASTAKYFEKVIVRSWTFNSTKIKVGENIGLVPTVSTKRTDHHQSNILPQNTMHKVVIIVETLVLLIVLAILAYCIWRKKNDDDKEEEVGFASEMNTELEMRVTMPRRFSYHELAQVTANFAETEKLGEGSFGGVYKGFIEDLSMYVAVKRVSKTSKQGIKEYAAEVRIISRLRHKNLVQLTGWCHDKEELLLAYEFMENGSLDLHLFKGRSLLTWETRYKIALDLASALLYLHEEWEQCVLHRDIKSSNVMLDSNFNAKLGDFGLAKLVDHEKGTQTTTLAGTFGYMAPEYVQAGKATKESDVYSFGVVALEIACGQRPINNKDEENHIRLVDWVWGFYGTRTLLEAVDPGLESNFEEEEVKRLMIVGLWCAHPNSELRPSIRQAIKVLNSEASLPLLPSKIPVASFMEHPRLSNFNTISKYKSSSGIS